MPSKRFTPAAVKVALGGMVCQKMQRAWRNRSNCTVWPWQHAADALTGRYEDAGAIYAACALFTDEKLVFDGGKLTAEQWQTLASSLPGIIADPPESALCRHAYEQRRRLTDPAESGLFKVAGFP